MRLRRIHLLHSGFCRAAFGSTLVGRNWRGGRRSILGCIRVSPACRLGLSVAPSPLPPQRPNVRNFFAPSASCTLRIKAMGAAEPAGIPGRSTESTTPHFGSDRSR